MTALLKYSLPVSSYSFTKLFNPEMKPSAYLSKQWNVSNIRVRQRHPIPREDVASRAGRIGRIGHDLVRVEIEVELRPENFRRLTLIVLFLGVIIVANYMVWSVIDTTSQEALLLTVFANSQRKLRDGRQWGERDFLGHGGFENWR